MFGERRRQEEVLEEVIGRYRITLAAAAALLAALLLAGACSEENARQPHAPDQSAAQAAQNIPQDEPVARVAAKVEPSVVQVNTRAIQLTPFGPESQSGVGSGVIYREDGYIITNNHVVEGADEVNVAFADGSTERGRVVGSDPRTDIAVVKVDRDSLPAAAFSDAEPVVGQLAVAIGSPSGFESTVTAGVVSGLDREIPPQLTGTGYQIPSLTGLIQTDAAISPGSSGGALANRSGEIIGINVAYLPPQTGAESIGFAIPASVATSVADQLIESGEVRAPFLGIVPVDLTSQEAELYGLEVTSGALVARVEPGSPADEAGLRRGDIIVALDGTEIRSSGDLYSALRDYRPGDEVRLTVVRNGERQRIEVTLGERP
ncbi:S1C family serine protease [Rubrobacter xylanophilus]|uniref:S1C family serine protease n=1 Tax=Rubrobacter xylanophilus TaxID=49319 RepID=UPI00003A260C|nr:trypsin-like peptidase domain-containing protein [Rubrobacter xylanophilus]